MPKTIEKRVLIDGKVVSEVGVSCRLGLTVYRRHLDDEDNYLYFVNTQGEVVMTLEVGLSVCQGTAYIKRICMEDE